MYSGDVLIVPTKPLKSTYSLTSSSLAPTYFLTAKLLVINFQYLLVSVQYLVGNSENGWNPTPTSSNSYPPVTS